MPDRRAPCPDKITSTRRKSGGEGHGYRCALRRSRRPSHSIDRRDHRRAAAGHERTAAPAGRWTGPMPEDAFHDAARVRSARATAAGRHSAGLCTISYVGTNRVELRHAREQTPVLGVVALGIRRLKTVDSWSRVQLLRFQVSQVRKICPAIFSESASSIGSNFCIRPAKQSARYRFPS